LIQRGLAVADRMDWENIIPRLEELLSGLLEHKDKIHSALRKELARPTVPWTIKT